MGTLLIGASFLLLNIAPLFIIALLGMLVITFGEMFLFPFMNNFWVRRSNERNRGQYAALYNMAFALGNVLAPSLASQIAVRAGFSVLWTLDFIICLVAGTGFLLMKRNRI